MYAYVHSAVCTFTSVFLYFISFHFILFQRAGGFHYLLSGHLVVGSERDKPRCVSPKSVGQEGVHEVRELISQPVSRSVSQPVRPSIRQSASQPASQEVRPFVSQPAS